ncbi:MAG: DUF1800 domain-containing protein, partial [Burkholderiales bacterium]|nr:DUF1800 domain-containing protein [Burkholderiales bacterium]
SPPPAGAGPNPAPQPPPRAPVSAADPYPWLNRLSWGASPSSAAQAARLGLDAYLAQQLRPGPAHLPGEAEGAIAAMTISQQPPVELARAMEQRRREAASLGDDDAKKAALQAYQREMTRLARESAARHVLRALYSSNQVQEQMTWFWLNHFSVFAYKGNIRSMIADYEDSAIRPHALGRFRALLGAVTLHPVMLRFLDNDRNAAGRVNENFARELMELHTLGVEGGYGQRDVQELARVLTGAGVNLAPQLPRVRPALQAAYVRRGLFEFNPMRHDFGPKELLGAPIRARGLGEIEEALDRLARHPSTARFVCTQLCRFWLADDPAPALVARGAEAFRRSDGDIAQTLHALFTAPGFGQGAGRHFKDPMRYVISALRLAYDERVILNAGPVLNWLQRMGEPLYGRQTPDGWPLAESAWSSPGQMATRFEIARAIGSGNAGLFRTDGPAPQERPAFPQLSNALYFESISRRLSPATKQALDQSRSPQEWNTFLLASPEMMSR